MTETIILGGGCFWCTESVFQSLNGVTEVTPGYSGGHVDDPTYEQVCSKNTGHIEVVRVRFDPQVISLAQILSVFFATHDPTTPDRQGGDVGPQYASAVFCETSEQRKTVEDVVKQVERLLETPVVTKVLDAQRFWPAEDIHHNYYLNNPGQGYCQVVIQPKLAALRRHFAELLATGASR